jgi:uncharacterized membrane-anchored protein
VNVTMTEPTNDRLTRFKEELSEMKVPDPAPSRDRTLVGLGVALMVAGIVVGIVAYNMSHTTTNPLQQNDANTLGLIGIAVALVGGFVFLRYSLAGFLRFWLARALFDQREREERLLQLLDERRES